MLLDLFFYAEFILRLFFSRLFFFLHRLVSNFSAHFDSIFSPFLGEKEIMIKYANGRESKKTIMIFTDYCLVYYISNNDSSNENILLRYFNMLAKKKTRYTLDLMRNLGQDSGERTKKCSFCHMQWARGQ